MKLILFFITLFISCNTAKKVNSNNTSKKEYAIEILTKGSHGGTVIAENRIIKNKKELKAVYTQINMFRKPGIPVPEINFKTEMVVALFMGEKTSGGYAIEVLSVSDIDDKVEVLIKETVPEGMATMAITQPYLFFKMSFSDKKIIFKII